ncbi:MAG: hypothetical protein ACLFSQ_10515 [Candidatus Zixiibacteriota bacterium]
MKTRFEINIFEICFAMSLLIMIFFNISCTDNSDNDTVELNDILSQHQQLIVEGTGISIYSGEDAPNIEGRFAFSPVFLEESSYESDNPGTFTSDFELEFYNQTKSGEILAHYWCPEIGADVLSNYGFVFGTGNRFTVYFEYTDEASNIYGEAIFTSVIVVSGNVTSSGISSAEACQIMTDKSDPYDILKPVNNYRYFIDFDGNAVRID